MDFLRHWNLCERPFEATWDARFFYASANHKEALNRLLYAAEERSLNACLLTGDIGCGKTLTRSVFAHHLDARRSTVVTVDNLGLGFDEMLATILRRLDAPGLDSVTSRSERGELLGQMLEKSRASGRHTVVLIDEAQDMTPGTLGQLRWLTNFNREGRTFITLALIGQTELRPMVQATPALDQRISLRFHLRPLELQDISNYLAHRLRVAGHPSGAVFTEDTAAEIFAATKGVPREVNRLAKLAMECAWLVGRAHVDSTCVTAVLNDLTSHQNLVAA